MCLIAHACINDRLDIIDYIKSYTNYEENRIDILQLATRCGSTVVFDHQWNCILRFKGMESKFDSLLITLERLAFKFEQEQMIRHIQSNLYYNKDHKISYKELCEFSNQVNGDTMYKYITLYEKSVREIPNSHITTLKAELYMLYHEKFFKKIMELQPETQWVKLLKIPMPCGASFDFYNLLLWGINCTRENAYD